MMSPDAIAKTSVAYLTQSPVIVIADGAPPDDRRRQSHSPYLLVDGASVDRKPETNVRRAVPAFAEVDEVEDAEETDREVDVAGVLALTDGGASEAPRGGRRPGSNAAPGDGSQGYDDEQGQGEAFQLRISLDRTTERETYWTLLQKRQ